VTELDAMKKWCPFARGAAGTDTTAVTLNRDSWGRPHSDCLCLGSDCMAWRTTWYGSVSCGLVTVPEREG
jgi:hypothetical protein